ncbi:MAG: DUF3151 domain-containing protein, partial [Actinomycetota bacterium]|nr:DUF3151 domain-containing protein [Actinomycetota bacterium]
MTTHGNLLGPDATLLPEDPAADAELAAADDPSPVAASHPAH